MAHKRGIVSRKTEDQAIDPTLINRSSKSFVAPYGSISREITSRIDDEDKAMRRLGADREAEQAFGWLNKYAPPKEETPPKEEQSDSEIISQAGIVKNERHTRMMERDYIFPHERRFLAEDWSETEASEYDRQVLAHAAQRDARLSGIMAEQAFGWLNKYASGVEEYVELPDFETLDLDDPEIIPESTSNQHSPIFTSTGRVCKEKSQPVSIKTTYMQSRKDITKSLENIGKLAPGEILPLDVSFALYLRLTDMGYNPEESAEIILNRYYR